MSLQSDLARNLAVFERLTSQSGDERETLPAQRTPMEMSVLDEAPRQNPVRAQAHHESEPARTAFSLSYGSRTLPTGFEAPGAISHPGLNETKRTSSSDPLESLYYQLEVDARRGSQLTGEDGFYD